MLQPEGHEALEINDPEIAEILQGGVDLHVHPSPSPFPRRLSIAEAAWQAHEAGFRAILVKSHHHSMVTDIAAASQGLGGLPIPVVSGVALNNYVGGLNPYAAELALSSGGRMVWFPTISSHAHICVHEAEGQDMRFPTNNLGLRHTTEIGILDGEGAIQPEVLDILEVIKSHDAIMSCGHLDADQTERLIKQAASMGIGRILVNHPNFVIGAEPERVREWVALGARIEHSICQYDDRTIFYQWGLDVLLGFIKAAGIENTLLGSDLGQANNPLPMDAYQKIARGLLDAGMSKADVRKLVVDNPATLLGI
ncbi:hypothetical protein QO003_003107 [Arthrobacter silviterrae]|uniref:Cytosolic protein n=1 Tax=Arthrobacter silviterrae TaxID=2026658 RepID=A0ABX0DIC9_9MICC|nr:DUF6282 family protein [Arthrobacter silviterrae]MDQ0278804.1 hypothetical protein [Arthrobacter silviterrae]NGN83972.1 hypothetical protein [Arthrobacter silviterrae]